MEPIMACRICLNTDVKLYEMSRYRLKSAYEDLCGVNLRASGLEQMLQHLCTYCAAMLHKFTLFKERCEQAAHLMEILLAECMQLTTDHIRKINKLEPNIALPYTTQPVLSLDSSTEIKEEKIDNNLTISELSCSDKLTDECDSKGLLEMDFTDFAFKSDSDDEPLSKKVKKRKKISKKVNCASESLEVKQEMESIKSDGSVENWESEYDLVLLTMEEQIEEVLARKNSLNYQNSMYKCEYCFKGFMTEVTFKNHMVQHDLSSGALRCGVCASRWRSLRGLRAHAALHARRYRCRRCPHAARSPHKAREHLNWHRGYLFTCKLCSATFSKSTTHLTHMRLRHPSTAACDACGDRFLNENGLNLHKKKAHRLQDTETSVQYVECDICGSRFRSENALKIHQDLAENSVCDTKLRACEYCGESCADEESLQQHAEMHRRAAALRTCSQCARTFSNERALALHAARTHGARAGGGRGARGAHAARTVCEVCGYSCISRASLVCHQRIHSGEKPYQCSLCPKRFSVSQRLQIHIRTHTGERPFQCAHCPKAFKHKAALNRHDRVHTGARPYRCPTCGKCFSQSNSMKQHAASVHLKAPLYARKPPAARLLSDAECQA